MPVLHRREDGSGCYIRARVARNWITWQVTVEGQSWLAEGGFRDGESIDLELVDMLRDKGWLYTAGSGAGVAVESGRPSFIRAGEGVKHAEFGIGEIREVLQDGHCRIVFFREYPATREVPTEELSAARSIELARERSAAYTRAEHAREAGRTRSALEGQATLPRPMVAAPPTPRMELARPVGRPPQAGTKARSSAGCFGTFVGVVLLMYLLVSAVTLGGR